MLQYIKKNVAPLMPKIRLCYIIYLLMMVFLERIICLDFIISGNKVFTGIAILGGALLILLDLLTDRSIFSNKLNYILIAFLGVCVISSIINFQYGFVDNIKTLIWLGVQFFILFTVNPRYSREQVIREIKIIGIFVSVIMFAASAASIVTYVFQMDFLVTMSNGVKMRQGFYDGRLFGVFRDPNYAAIMALIALVLSVLLLIKYSDRLYKKVICVISIAVQYTYIILSNSRTGHIAVLAAVFVASYFVLNSMWMKKVKKDWLRVSTSLITSIAILFVSMGALSYSKDLLKYAHVKVDTSQGENPENPIDDDDILERPDIDEGGNKYVSKSRLMIWESAIEIFTSAPVFGVSPRNTWNYADKNFPEGFISVRHYSTHNGYIDLLMCTGIVGTLVMLAFLCICIYKALKLIFIRRKYLSKYKDVIFCGIIVLIIAISACFLSEIFFLNTFSADLFWLFLGYVVFFVNKDNEPEMLN